MRAILEGKKTQTRRVISEPDNGITTTISDGQAQVLYEDGVWRERISPFGATGDRLWVREGFWPAFKREGASSGCVYRADYLKPTMLDPTIYFQKVWTPSIHMPRWASRLTLEITDMRVERLQDISGEDCRAEGIALSPTELYPHTNTDYKLRVRFGREWDQLNKREVGWDKNPWVWVITFRRLDS